MVVVLAVSMVVVLLGILVDAVVFPAVALLVIVESLVGPEKLADEELLKVVELSVTVEVLVISSVNVLVVIEGR